MTPVASNLSRGMPACDRFADGASLVRSSSLGDCDAMLLDQSLGGQLRTFNAPPVISTAVRRATEPPRPVEVQHSWSSRIREFYVQHPVYAWLIQQVAIQGIAAGLNLVLPGSGLVAAPACRCGGAAAAHVTTLARTGLVNAAVVGTAQMALVRGQIA